jgi:hypothetical protein
VAKSHELVVIGARLAADLVERLHACCLSDTELASGPSAWLGLDDPFPAWWIAAENEDDTLDEDEASP